jgi:hypothetical protein
MNRLQASYLCQIALCLSICCKSSQGMTHGMNASSAPASGGLEVLREDIHSPLHILMLSVPLLRSFLTNGRGLYRSTQRVAFSFARVLQFTMNVLTNLVHVCNSVLLIRVAVFFLPRRCRGRIVFRRQARPRWQAPVPAAPRLSTFISL